MKELEKMAEDIVWGDHWEDLSDAQKVIKMEALILAALEAAYRMNKNENSNK